MNSLRNAFQFLGKQIGTSAPVKATPETKGIGKNIPILESIAALRVATQHVEDELNQVIAKQEQADEEFRLRLDELESRKPVRMSLGEYLDKSSSTSHQ